MDETPLTFDMPPNRTINDMGEKTIKIRTTGNEEESHNCCVGVCWRRIAVQTNGDIQKKNCAQGCQQAWSRDYHPRERLDGH